MIIGFRPQQETQKLIEQFENEVMIWHNNQPLVGTVYVDIQEERWSVAFAYNFTRKPGIHGHENPLESRYLVKPQEKKSVHLFRSDEEEERVLEAGQFSDGDSLIRFALTQERSLAAKAA